MRNSFYRAFEDRHRGSRDEIKVRQQVYLSFIEPLKQLYEECLALDLGCGRGEWLELLRENGYQAKGVDLDEGMLEACTSRDLVVEQEDALSALRKLPNESQVIVSGFHIAEHIDFNDLAELVDQALRVLKPAGILILETPNPENLLVGAQNFYLDPTHERPLPKLLLSFLAEYYGFKRIKTLGLQESMSLDGETKIQLMDVIGGVSPDYALVAQKAAEHKIMSLFDESFNREFGVSLHDLAVGYQNEQDQKLEQSFDCLRNQVFEFSQHCVDLAEKRAQEAENRAREQEQRAIATESRAQEQERRAVLAEERADDWSRLAMAQEEQMGALLRSTSWRITRPLRKSKYIMHWLIARPVKIVGRLIRLLKRAARRLIFNIMGFAGKYSIVKFLAIKILGRFPALKRGLRQLALRRPNDTPTDDHNQLSTSAIPETSALSAYTREVLFALETAMDKKSKGIS